MKKNLKRKLICLLTALLVTMSFTASVFALSTEELLDEMKKSPNAMALVFIDNEECLELPNLKDLQVRVSAEGTGIDLRIPVEKVEVEGEFLGMWLGVPKEKISDAIMKELGEIQGKIDLGAYEENPDDLLTEIDKLLSHFQVEVLGLPEGHYITQGTAVVITSEIYKQVIDMAIESAKELFGEDVTSFSQIIEKLLAENGLTLDDIFNTADFTEEDWADLATLGITKEDIEAMKSLIQNIDPIVDYLTSEEFSGLLFAGAELSCSCPFSSDFQIIHRYYKKVDGKLKMVGTVFEGEYDPEWDDYYITGTSGDVIKASDYIQPVYKGKTYEYMGSYDSITRYKGFDWDDYKMDSFVLDDEDSFTDGLILRYVIDVGGNGAENSGGENGSAGHGGDGTGNGSGQTAPKTGDESPLGMYVLLMAAAAGALGCAAAYRRKNS